MKLSEIPFGKFNGEAVDNCIFVSYHHLYKVPFRDIFEWIKREAKKDGLTVELKEDKIIFIKNENKSLHSSF